MVQDKELTDIMFRVDTTPEFAGTVFALMLHDCADQQGHITSYQHIGQHSAADYFHCIAKSRPATPQESESLKAELEAVGYNVKVAKRRNYKKYLNSYYKQKRA